MLYDIERLRWIAITRDIYSSPVCRGKWIHDFLQSFITSAMQTDPVVVRWFRSHNCYQFRVFVSPGKKTLQSSDCYSLLDPFCLLLWRLTSQPSKTFQQSKFPYYKIQHSLQFSFHYFRHSASCCSPVFSSSCCISVITIKIYTLVKL